MNQRRGNGNNQQVAVLEPPRMQMPAHVSDQYGLNQDTWRALTDAVFPLAKTVGAVLLALAYCERNRLDVFQRVVHIVPMYVNGRTVETVWPGIGQVRIIAQRQESFAGYDDCEFGPDITTEFKGKVNEWDNGQRAGTKDVSATVTYPEWARFVVYKMLHGQRTRLPGPKVYFTEIFASRSHFGGEVPNEKWARSPRQMLEKCAEAAAYRRAFPDVLGNEMAAEEMEGRRLDPNGSIDAEYVVVDEGQGEQQAQKKAKPKASDFQQGGGEQVDQASYMSGSAQTREEATAGRFREGEGEQVDQPERERPKASPLDLPGIPADDGEWTKFEELLRERLDQLATPAEVDAEQERQQFRIDAADMKRQQVLYDMFVNAAADKEGK